MEADWYYALFGGALIGISALLVLAGLGKIAGISGIFANSFIQPSEDRFWRRAFVFGMFSAGLLSNFYWPASLQGKIESDEWTVIVAGLLVGFGTRLGNGCTSGHGVCGISRFSLPSLLATICFILSGMISVYLFKQIGWIS